jgi:hypothetical protein
MIDGRLVPDVLADLRDFGSLAHVNLLIEVNAGPIAAIHRPPRGKAAPGKGARVDLPLPRHANNL